MKPIAILAGTRNEYEAWLDANGHTSKTAVHCFTREIIQSHEFNRIEEVGTFWKRKDARDLYQTAMTHVR